MDRYFDKETAPFLVWGNVKGYKAKARTSKHRVVTVWVPDDGNDINTQYFCHGHTLDTYRLFKYSVFSGEFIKMALQDEYNEITVNDQVLALNKIKPGDIISFSNNDNVILHTSLVVNVPMNNGTAAEKGYNRKNVSVWTKNGRKAATVEKLLETCAQYTEAPKLRYWQA